MTGPATSLLLIFLTRPAAGFSAMPFCRPNPASVSDFEEPAAIAAAAKVTSAALTLPASLADGPIESSFISTGVDPQPGVPPIILLHSFDSSCLEYRRVLPLLAEKNLEAYALDILGWGFSDTSNARGVSVEAKRAHLFAFVEQHLKGRPAILVGSSLGAATIIDFVASYASSAEGVVLCDPQALIDGTPPVPSPLARGGVRLLKSWPLRALGQKIAYEDLGRCDTDDAIRIGRVHCERERWEDDAVDWLLGGGYSVSSLLPTLRDTRCLILWGRQDRVLPPQDNVPTFLRQLPSADFRWVEQCGHVRRGWSRSLYSSRLLLPTAWVASPAAFLPLLLLPLIGDSRLACAGASPRTASSDR